MGDLPLHRVNPPTRPFITTGVDDTGAIELQAARVRGSTTYKGYVAIFICLATKAVHLEAVTGLSTEHFLHVEDKFNICIVITAQILLARVHRLTNPSLAKQP